MHIYTLYIYVYICMYLLVQCNFMHLQNVICRTNVPKKVKDNVIAAQDFYSLVTNAHIVAAAMQHFHMAALDGEPAAIAAPMDPTALPAFMIQTVGKLVNKYVMKFMEMKEVSNTLPSSALPNASQQKTKKTMS